MADNSLAVAVPAPKFGDGWLSAFSLVAVAALVFSFFSFQRAGSQGGGNNGHLPAPVEAAGKAVFSTAPGACGSCHGATGGGGVGPKLAGGAVVQTYPSPADQVAWVLLGSEGGAALYKAAGKDVKGGMPAFAGKLTLQQVVDVVLYERQAISGVPIETEIAKWADLRKLPATYKALNISADDVEKVLADLATATGQTIPKS